MSDRFGEAVERSVNDVGMAYARLAETLVSVALSWPQPGASRASRTSDSADRTRMRQTLWRLRRAYEDIIGPGGTQSLTEEVRQLGDIVSEAGPALMVWVDAVESLVQDAERRYGSTPGQGAKKAEEVKSALIHILLNSNIHLPNIPAFLEPVLFEIIVSWTVDAIVLLLNRNQLWDLAKPPAPAPGLLKRVLTLLLKPLLWVADRLSGVMRRWVLSKHPLPPSVEAMVRKLEKEKLPGPDLFVQLGADTLKWLGRNRKRVLGLVEIISIGAKEAESFLEKSGREKKAYVRNLLLLFLEDIGVLQQGSILNATVEWLADIAIDAIVLLFNKRQLFRSSGSSTRSQGQGA